MAFFTTNTDQFRKYVPVTVNYTLDDVLPFLDNVACSVLPRFLGDALLEDLQTLAKADPEGQSSVQQRSIELARKVVACLGFGDYLPFSEVQIDDSGISVAAREGRKPAYDYQTKKILLSLLESGWRALEELISLTDKNRDTFPAWENSPYFEQYQELSFKTPAEFSRYYPIQDRWLTFWALRPFLDRVEQLYGDAARARIDALATPPTESQSKDLQKKLRFALAYQTVLEAIPNLSIELSGVNVQVNYASQFGGAAQYFQPPGKDQLGWVMDTLSKQAELAWSSFNSAVDALIPADPTTNSAGGPIGCHGGLFML